MCDMDEEISLQELDYGIDEDEEEYEYLALPDVDEEYLDDIKQDDTQVLNKIPFTKIHEPPLPFDSPKRRCFMPGQKIHVKIIDIEQTDTGLFNPNLYVIHLSHGDYQWTIRRRYKHFRALHDSLMLFKAKVAVSVPTKTVKERRKSFAVRKQHLPKFPKTPDPLVRTDNIDKRKDQLEAYLQNLLKHPQFRNHPDTLKFLEVSHLTFVNGLGGKWREGMMRKRAGGRRIKLKTCGCCPTCHCTAMWNNRWLILKDTFVAYISPKTGAIGDVMLMDRDFSAQNGLIHTGISHGLIVSNLSRHLIMKCETHRQAEEWCEDIDKAIREKGHDFTKENRYHSFAPIRNNAFVNWFVDGANYMAAVADAIEGAKEEIFITDWWLSPELYLKRPITEQQLYRLDLLLGRKAAEGVHIYVLLFKEMEVALGINSFHTKQTLVKQHPNIRVLRHPDGITLWSHHEKIVVIDQRIAFLGGIDLCFGRWDTKAHRLTDLGKNMVPTDLRRSCDSDDSDSEEEPLDVITEEPEDDDAFVNINLNNNLGDKDGESNGSNDNDDDLNNSDGTGESDDDIDHRVSDINLNSNTQLSESSQLLSKMELDTTKRYGSQKQSYEELNFNNNGNGEDARKKERRLSGKGYDGTGPYPPPPEPFRTMISHLKWDSDAERDTEESDVDGGPEHTPYVDKRAIRNAKHVTLDPDYHGSYANPDMDRITYDEQLDRRFWEETSDGMINGDIPKGHTNRHADRLTKQGHRSELTLIVSPNGNYLTVNDDMKPDAYPSDGRRHKNSANRAVNEDMNAGVPVIEITDTSRQNRGQKARPILRNLPRQMTFDEDDPDFMPIDECPTIENVDKVTNLDDNKTYVTNVDNNKTYVTNVDNNRPSAKARASAPVPKKEYFEKPVASRIQSAKSSVSKQDSNTSNASSSSLDSQFSKEGNPKSFRTYLQSMLQDVIALDKEQNRQLAPSGTPAPSVFQTGLSGLSVMNTTPEVKTVDPSKSVSPHNRRRLRPPKLHLGMKHFAKGSVALDEDTAATLAETGGRLPSVANRDSQKVKYVVQSGGTDTDQAVTIPVRPKPTTPEPKRKIYDIKERFRKNKMMSVDVTDDDFAYAWKDSVNDTRHILNPHELIEIEGREGEVKFWIGKDYANFIYKDFVDLDQPFTDMIDRTEIPRMPWHDIGCMVAGKAARDVARHFIQRWNYTKLSKQKANSVYPMLLPKSYSKVSLPQWVVSESYCAKCQILRSSCEWSAGIKTIECSIHEAYVDLILKAKHFIYIENQFFVTIMDHDVVENQIARALYERILAAHKKKEIFRVYVVMPLLPAFEGELGTNTGTSIQAVTHWNYASICRGGKSLLERLAKHLRDPFEYISFFGLRTYERLGRKLTSELVYVHSKLMIVDDRSVILGSANINDRSLVGKRDSEIAIVIEDKHTVTTTFNGVNVEVGKFASDMRRNIFREHLGLKEDDPVVDVCDPVSNVFYKSVWLRQASINTTIFEQVFNCIPSDTVQTYVQLRNHQKEIPLAITKPEKAEKKLRKIKGHLVLLPLLFLCKENLGNLTGTKEGLMPNIIWT